MAVVYSAAVKTARMVAVRDQIDSGATAGKLEIGTAGMATVLATINLDDPCGTVTAGVLTLTGFPKSDASAIAAGTAAAARIRNGDNVDVITGLTVGVSSADITLSSVNLSPGQAIIINSAALAHA